MGFKVTKSDLLFKGKVFNVQVDEIEYDSGNRGIREVAVHPGGAVILAVTNNGKIIMVNQFRYPLQKNIFELPAGKLENNEDPYDCAVRELEEETGYKAKKVEKLGQIYTTPGFCTEILHIYLARDLVQGDHNREEGEQGMQIFEFSRQHIEEKIKNNEITDAKSICGIYLAQKYI
jgi:ADP-ribose pyrophosphatase